MFLSIKFLTFLFLGMRRGVTAYQGSAGTDPPRRDRSVPPSRMVDRKFSVNRKRKQEKILLYHWNISSWSAQKAGKTRLFFLYIIGNKNIFDFFQKNYWQSKYFLICFIQLIKLVWSVGHNLNCSGYGLTESQKEKRISLQVENLHFQERKKAGKQYK